MVMEWKWKVGPIEMANEGYAALCFVINPFCSTKFSKRAVKKQIHKEPVSIESLDYSWQPFISLTHNLATTYQGLNKVCSHITSHC